MRLDLSHTGNVKKILFNPEVVDDMCDDFATKAMAEGGPYFEINAVKNLLSSPTVWMVQPSEFVLFMVTVRTSVLYEVHTIILPEGRGRSAVIDTKSAAKWLFENSECEKIITYIPMFNKKARVFAKLAGMKDEGICTKSFKKHGVLHDQWVMGLEKESICQQLQ